MSRGRGGCGIAAVDRPPWGLDRRTRAARALLLVRVLATCLFIVALHAPGVDMQQRSEIPQALFAEIFKPCSKPLVLLEGMRSWQA
eukprot:2664185-Amphidinium_carterae.2